ncbi:glycoside hydrolase family 92 protein [Mucilaginibacter sp. UR6-1]|uniref:glycoside hydrolase domain-containing protein n=1 Tax=Mucilaginibacter sp. UR6-1 TaxID=1435643 RepID=UPI001E350DF6|nr:glycoside hydrolase domain-containing protein [Mucilaginibacter sp. UR6-1]MCC8410124.1 glycoside hydrolase family 92 protein [Mucilaginibacter sp. UR6-1]
MKKCTKLILWSACAVSLLQAGGSFAQQDKAANDPTGAVNVFLGTSGDHGQLSPAASYPFGMLSIAPQTYPNLHAGYEHNAKKVLGFTHTRFEGVGCMGSGGSILIKPFIGNNVDDTELLKSSEAAGPGFYRIGFENGISVNIAVNKNSGTEAYTFPIDGKRGFYINLSHTLANGFVAEEHTNTTNSLSGWVDARTTCGAGVYRLYYSIDFSSPVKFEEGTDHKLIARVEGANKTVLLNIGISSVDVAHAQASAKNNDRQALQTAGNNEWNKILGAVEVNGDAEKQKLFYSLLYRTVQSPYLISEADGAYRGTDGSLQKTGTTVYNGWSIWDNYRTQLPLMSLLYPDKYADMVTSIAAMYKYGKKDYATQHEPSNTVRTEHALVVLLDAWRKGFKFDIKGIADSLIAEGNRLDFAKPDKALESSYDAWALSHLMDIAGRKTESAKFHAIALKYKDYWEKDFKDITKRDVDRMQARGLYQGTIWQYRWFVPFDVKGLISLVGGEQKYMEQLDYFFANDLYNHANEPDIQAPFMYNMTSQPWKSQQLAHKYAADTVVQYYFNDNSRGIDPFVNRIYRNQTDTYVRTMDDDGGAMSAWYVFTACGIMPACVGEPVFYLNAPLFSGVKFNFPDGKKFNITTNNFGPKNIYVTSATLNGKPLERNWLTYAELRKGGTLNLTLSNKPDKSWGTKNQYITDINAK